MQQLTSFEVNLFVPFQVCMGNTSRLSVFFYYSLFEGPMVKVTIFIFLKGERTWVIILGERSKWVFPSPFGNFLDLKHAEMLNGAKFCLFWTNVYANK